MVLRELAQRTLGNTSEILLGFYANCGQIAEREFNDYKRYHFALSLWIMISTLTVD